MTFNLVIILIFFTALIVIAILYRKSTLDNLAMLQGETVLFEERGVRVEQRGSPQSTIFINCIIRVTDRRIIIAQKIFFSKNKYALRHVITYSGTDDDIDLKAVFKSGYLTFSIKKSNIQIESPAAGKTIKISIPESFLTKGQYIQYNTIYGEDYERIFT